jgi:hypothetical protein
VAQAVREQGAPRMAAIAALVLLGLVGSATVAVRGAISHWLGVPDRTTVSVAFHLLVWSILPTAAFHVAAIWASIVYTPVRWSHVRYKVDRHGQVLAAEHSPHRSA